MQPAIGHHEVRYGADPPSLFSNQWKSRDISLVVVVAARARHHRIWGGQSTHRL
jgi:hypothetical protein